MPNPPDRTPSDVGLEMEPHLKRRGRGRLGLPMFLALWQISRERKARLEREQQCRRARGHRNLYVQSLDLNAAAAI
jgi:hypothetical protein